MSIFILRSILYDNFVSYEYYIMLNMCVYLINFI